MIDITNIEVRKKLIDQIGSWQNIQRKNTSLRQYRCYNENLDQYVQEKILQQFSPETVKMMPIISSINLVKRITDQSSQIYIREPVRTFTNLDEQSSKTVLNIYADFCINTKLLRSHRFYNLQNQNFLYLILKDKKLKACPLLKHQIDAIPNDEDPEKADGYIISNYDREPYLNSPDSWTQNSQTGFRGSSQAGYIGAISESDIASSQDYKKTLQRFTFWTKEFNFVCDGTGKIISGENINNDIGIIPIIDIASNKDYNFFVEQGSSLVEFALEYNLGLTDLMFISRLQGFSQGVIQGDKEVLDKMTTIQLGPTHIIKLPSSPIDNKPTEFKFVNRGSDIEGTMKALEMLLSNFLTSKGMDPKTISGNAESTKFNSGFERFLSLIDKFETSKSDYDLYKYVEYELFEIMSKYLNLYSNTEFLDKDYWVSIPDNTELNIQFYKPEVIQSEAEKTDLIIKKLEAGLISKIEAIMQDRGIDQEKAEEVLESINNQLIETTTDEGD
jgi:hypothetical protein